MSKIWILDTKYGKKKKVFNSESQLLKNISTNSDQVILEYELVSSVKSSDFFKTKERDIQLRSVLGELDKKEESIGELISLYEEVAPDLVEKGRRVYVNGSIVQIPFKQTMIGQMKKYQSDKKSFCDLLIKNKIHFISQVSDSVEWYTKLLKVHNFMDCGYVGDTNKTNFNVAKKNLRKKPIKNDNI